jgi:hypothetical protein
MNKYFDPLILTQVKGKFHDTFVKLNLPEAKFQFLIFYINIVLETTAKVVFDPKRNVR